jgi:hypothetical protein
MTSTKTLSARAGVRRFMCAALHFIGAIFCSNGTSTRENIATQKIIGRSSLLNSDPVRGATSDAVGEGRRRRGLFEAPRAVDEHARELAVRERVDDEER